MKLIDVEDVIRQRSCRAVGRRKQTGDSGHDRAMAMAEVVLCR